MKEILRPLAEKQIAHDIQGNIKLKVIHALDILVKVWSFREKREPYHTYLHTPVLQKLVGWSDFLIAVGTRRDSQVNTDWKFSWNKTFPG